MIRMAREKVAEGEDERDRDRNQEWGEIKKINGPNLIISTLGLFSPLKKWLLRSVLTTSLSTVNWTFLQNSLCSSGLMDSLWESQENRKGKLELPQRTS